MRNLFRNSLVAALVAFTAGCGGTGGGSGGTTGVDVMPSGGATSLGSRGVPGGTVTVFSDRAIIAGAENTFHLVLSNGMIPTQVTAWIRTPTDDGAGIPATPSQTGPGTYDINLMMPVTVVTGSHVWVRLTFADGSVIETGTEDFPLTRN